jgi:N-acetylneuraminate synthase
MKKQNTIKSGKVFIIAEAGSNWRMGERQRDIRMAKALIEHAAEANVDAIKFQSFAAKNVYAQNAGLPGYMSKSDKSINEIFEDISLPLDILPLLADHCRMCGINFLSSVFSIEDAKTVDPFVSIHKIASYEITHSRLIEFVARTGKPLLLSTGASTYEEVEWALQHFRKHGGKKVTLMQTTAKYPAPLSTLNLRTIHTMATRFGVPVGLSDHSRDPVIGPVAAVALGATAIEKHFTLHNSLPGPDHAFALTPKELKEMVGAIRDAEHALGSGEKSVLPEEQELRKYAQRGIQATRAIKKGEALKEGVNIDILRPGRQKKGLHPRYLPEIEGRRAKRNIHAGDGIASPDY